MQWNVALDIGASGIRMALRGKGVVFSGSAAAALRGEGAKPFALGDEALLMHGRATGLVRAGFPMDAGQVADEDLLRAWLRHLLREFAPSGIAQRARVLIAHSPLAGDSAMKALAACCMESGAAGCSLIRSDMMAATGAGCDPMRPEAALVGELGAGAMAVTLFCMGHPVAQAALPWGLRRADEALATCLRSQYALDIGPRTAEELKMTVLNALGGQDLTVDVRGLDLNAGLPRTRKVEAATLQSAIRPVVEDFCALALSVVRRAPAELAADLAGGSIVLTGGGALLFGLDKLVAEATGLSVRLPEDPLGCVIRGLCEALEAPARFAQAAKSGAAVLKG
jgi:rod shape-determining protein MreB